jgi:hypothetical protein
MTIAKSTGQKLDLAHKYPNPKPNHALFWRRAGVAENQLALAL